MDTFRSRESTLAPLVAGIAHEVRNPLFGVTSILDAMSARVSDHPDFDRYLPSLRQEVQRIARIMDAILDYGVEPPFKAGRFPLVGAARAAQELTVSLATEHGVRVEIVESPPAPLAHFDPDLAAGLLRRLVDNAIRHSPRGGSVTISLRSAPDGTWAEAVVADEGAGITPEDLPHVFEPFFHRRADGVGMGLAIVRRLVELHGGTVEATNRPEGGAAFTLRIPAPV